MSDQQDKDELEREKRDEQEEEVKKAKKIGPRPFTKQVHESYAGNLRCRNLPRKKS